MNERFQLRGLVGRTYEIEVVIDISKDAQRTGPADVMGYRLAGLIVPALNSGALHFLVSDEKDGAYFKLVDASGAAIAIAVGAGECAVASDELAALCAYRFVKIEAQTPQTEDRTFMWILKG